MTNFWHRIRLLQLHWWEAQLLAVALVALGLLGRQALAAATGGFVPFGTMFPVILASAVLGGLEAGITATLLGLISPYLLALLMPPAIPAVSEDVVANLLVYLLLTPMLVAVGQWLRQTIRSLREKEEQWRLAQAISPEALIIVRAVRDGTGRVADLIVQYANPVAMARLRARHSLAGMSLRAAFLAPHEEFLQRVATVIDSGASLLSEEKWIADGTEHWFRTAVARHLDGAVLSFVDITATKLLEERQRAELEHREMLIREMNHRIMNNLQWVAGVLMLQADRHQSEAFHALMKDAADRIRTVADVHRHLHRADRVGTVQMAELLPKLTDGLTGMAAGTVQVYADRVELATDDAIAIGMIACELVTNALKHAYPADAGERGVTVTFTQVADRFWRLAVADQGSGVPGNFDPRQSSGLGMKIVRSLASQIDADFRHERNLPGSRFIVERAQTPAAA